MFRIRLVSGEDTVFRSVEELALGIQSGAVSPDAQIYHASSQEWLPISSHPEFEEARRRAAALAAIADPGPPPLPALIEAAGGTTVPIYQMISRSARELAERRRPRWVVPTASAVVGLAILGVVVLIMLPEPPGANEAIRLASSAPHPSSAPSHLAPILSEESMRAARNAPYNLAGRFSRAVDSTRRSLVERGTALDLLQLIHVDRLRSVAGLKAGRETLAVFDSMVRGFRDSQRRLDSMYRDSARILERRGDWSQTDLREWRVRLPQLESSADAARADSIMLSLNRLYTLLLDQNGSVTLTPLAVRFADPQSGLAYDALRTSLLRQTSEDVPEGAELSEPLTVLLGGMAGGALPLRTTR